MFNLEEERQKLDLLTKDIDNLSCYMYSDNFAKLPSVEFGLIMVQIRAMKMHKEALEDRVERMKLAK